ncbi:hypothetical protein BH11ARM1_BH11ARM1_15260 [soil metagenome]
MNEIRFGIIGGGLMGKEFASAAARWMHLTKPSAKPVITAVADPNPAALDWFKAHLPNLTATTDHNELLKMDLHAVYVAVPHNLHEQIYIDVLNAKKHLFAEKPFGIDLKAAQRIANAIQPDQIVRCSSEFPFYPGAQRIIEMIQSNAFGEIIEVRAGFLHSSDLDPNKPINWKRQIAMNGEYGCMGDLGLHVCHIPARFGWKPKNVRALLSNIVRQRPNSDGQLVSCETWDNAILNCETEQGFPMILETKRISPGDTNTWYIKILGTKNSAEFSTKRPKTLRTLPYQSGQSQAWREEDLGYDPQFSGITGHVFEFGFPDAMQQMWAAYLEELAGNRPSFGCATPEEALYSHRLFTAALESQKSASTVTL